MRLASALTVMFLAAPSAAIAQEPSAAIVNRGIANITAFLDRCPTTDPAVSLILADFEIRRDAQPTAVPYCTEPVSAMRVDDYSDELIILQTLRVAYYMDRGQAGHLSWTDGTLYDWMRTKIDGINIVSDHAGGGACCFVLDGKVFMSMGYQDDANREFDKTWRGISGNLAFYAHEARHADGYPHSSCCGIPGGCDDSFDAADPTPYAIQWWLMDLWYRGVINVGASCGSPSTVSTLAWWFLQDTDSFRERFCSAPPPLASSIPEPFGPCSPPPRRRLVHR